MQLGGYEIIQNDKLAVGDNDLKTKTEIAARSPTENWKPKKADSAYLATGVGYWIRPCQQFWVWIVLY